VRAPEITALRADRDDHFARALEAGRAFELAQGLLYLGPGLVLLEQSYKQWWAHLDSNQGPADYEGKASGRRFKFF